MQKFHIARRYVCKETSGKCFGGYFLDYYMLKSEIKIPSSNIKATVYGIEIEKRQSKNGIEKVVESACVNDIFSSREYTKKFISTLAKELVMPSTLKNVIGDMLGEKGFELPEVIYVT